MPVAFDRLQKEAAKNGIVIPEEFHQKMQKWCKKNGLLPADDVPVAEATVPESN